MSKYLVDGTDMTSVANAIRTAGGTSSQLAFPTGFVSAIGDLSGGGGASNLVVGTFTGTTAGSAMTINISYTGNGYPIACVISPSDGAWKANGSIRDVVQKSALVAWCMIKDDFSSAPTFSSASSAENKSSIFVAYKNSTSNASEIAFSGGKDIGIFTTSSSAGSSTGPVVRFNSKTSMSVFIADTAYGFKSGVEYKYRIIYSE